MASYQLYRSLKQLVWALGCLSLLACTAPHPPSAVPHTTGPATSSSTPSLLTLIVIDQLRGDEIERHDALWRHGIRQLLDEGRRYDSAHFGHGASDTASGHATLGSGTQPRTHGISGKDVYHQGKVCGFGEAGCGAELLRVPTLAARHKQRWPNGRSVSLSGKARAAIGMAGQAADLVAWMTRPSTRPEVAQPRHEPDKLVEGETPRTGSPEGVDFPASSVCVVEGGACLQGYAKRHSPLPDWLLNGFTQAAAPTRIANRWELPCLGAAVPAKDDAPGELDPGHGLVFPHTLPDTDARARYRAWTYTPDFDRALTDLAIQSARRLELGTKEQPDMLMVSYSALDYIGHAFGPDSLERQAALVAIDKEVGRLLEVLDELSGGNMVVMLTSDHGVNLTVAGAAAHGLAAGRVSLRELRDTVAAAMNEQLGPGEHIAHMWPPYLALGESALAHGVTALQVAQAGLLSHPAVYGAWPVDTLANHPDPIPRLIAQATPADYPAQLVFALRRHHSLGSQAGGANHGTPWEYDRHVPVILRGPGIEHGSEGRCIDPIDGIATLARILDVDMHGLEGEPLW